MNETKGKLGRLGVRPQKSRGQNFLQDVGFAAEIVAFSQIQRGEKTLEIGPGLGVLTAELLRLGCDLYCVELEDAFANNLPKQFSILTADRVWNQSVLEVDLGVVEEQWQVIGNIPYSISSEILFWILAQRSAIRTATLLVQREFAERVAAAPGSRAGGIPTLLRHLVSDAYLGPIIGGDSFHPPARVDSRVLRLEMLEQPRSEICPILYGRVLRAAFAQRRKTLLNSLTTLGISKAEVSSILNHAGIASNRRAETLLFEELVSLTESYKELCG